VRYREDQVVEACKLGDAAFVEEDHIRTCNLQHCGGPELRMRSQNKKADFPDQVLDSLGIGERRG